MMEGPLGTLRTGQLSSLIHALSLIHYHFSLHSHLAKASKVPSPPRSGDIATHLGSFHG